MRDGDRQDANDQTRHRREPVPRDWAWLDGVTGPVDADFAAGAEGSGLRVSAETVRFDADEMWVGLADGRVIGVPLAWFPRLRRATPAEGEGFEISPFGIHWETLDEDISVEGLLAGRGDRGRVGGEAT